MEMLELFFFSSAWGTQAFIIFFHSSDNFTQAPWLPCTVHGAALVIYNPLNHHLTKSKQIST